MSHLDRQVSSKFRLSHGKITNEYNQTYYRRKNYRLIWTHQFLRVKVLKDMFGHITRSLLKAKEMDYIVDNLSVPSSYDFYSNKRSLMVFGESTNRGKITKNCYKSLIHKIMKFLMNLLL